MSSCKRRAERPSTMLALAVALVTASIAGHAAAQDVCVMPESVARAADSATDTAEAPPEEAPPETHAAAPSGRADGRIKFQSFGGGFHATMFATEDNHGYTLMGPSVNYQYYVGRRWGFTLRGAVYFPVSGRYAGPSGDLRTGLRSTYSAQNFGLDGLIGVARRIDASPSLVLMFGAGVHVQSFKLSGPQYTPLEGITGGLGGFARLDWRVHRVVSLGADVAVGVDPLDFVRHQNRAVITVPVSIALSMGLTY